MPEEPTPKPDKQEEKSPWNEKLAELLIKAAIGGGAGTVITLLSSTELPRLALGAGIGGAATMVYAFVEPIAKRTNKGLGQAGDKTADAIGKKTEQVIATLTSAEDRYFTAQSQECKYCRTEGMAKVEGIFTPMLEKVYVPLELDRSAFRPGLMSDVAKSGRFDETDSDRLTRLDIWKLLAQTEKDLIYRRLVILAWGGYGKTTLLRHLAFTYGQNQQGSGLPRLVPILLLLRKYREELTQENPLSLPDLIAQKHIPNLPEGATLRMSPDWAKNILRRGDALVLVDGFDEVPKAQRPQVARWLNEQMRHYGKSTFILTSRPKAYQEQDQAMDTLELETILWVKDFQEKQRRQFVEQWYWCQEYYHHGKEDTPDIRREAQRSADELLAQIEARSELKDLAKNPLLLNMMATFHRRYPSAELPRRRVELYQEMCVLQLRDRPGARRLETILGYEEALVILQMLALEMMQQHDEQVSQEVILRRLTTYLTEQAETVSAADFLRHIEQVSELLVQREPEEYEFSHLSFQEYLAAKEIIRLKRESVLYQHFEDGWWKPTILLYAAQTNPTTLIRQAMQQGATDLAYTCWQDTTKRVNLNDAELEVLTQLTPTLQTSRYQTLEDLLKSGQWRDADQETYRLMITTVGKEEGQYFEPADLENFPCDDLRTLDQLWLRYSNGKWGFSVQKQIWQECGSPTEYSDGWEKFGDRVGWRKDDDWVDYDDLTFDLQKTRSGEFPREIRGSVLFSRAETCEL
ncbi:NACHT domain-containing protein [Myxacorys almedinensis]|uniref:NACHT domain-containing protein n=1 Tax=Myxacorys almedinensis A TaxID=2690445 RepID=A0A8J8CHW7_9CYAN|nr:GUN4 domain-containing protein [Myxacorys almedinensis]NDJ15876.1 NACHT domain-containing protein [Myxacorys almedinensis A]